MRLDRSDDGNATCEELIADRRNVAVGLGGISLGGRRAGRLSQTRVLVTGGAGFIGSHVAADLMRRGRQVLIIDDLSRSGAAQNVDWLESTGNPVSFERLDVRDANSMEDIVDSFRPTIIWHLAGQVAVTTSIDNPRLDFEVNAIGTMNLLEATRKKVPEARFIFASTNKVYGGLTTVGNSIDVEQGPSPITEGQPLDFRSPYGCSKGVADQYVLDYARTFGLQTTVLRLSCVYGPRQYGNEDQGWVSWFLMANHFGWPITIFGDGTQVRDLLFIDDFVALTELIEKTHTLEPGSVFNVGGGYSNAISVLELVAAVGQLTGRLASYSFAASRLADQAHYISDIDAVRRRFGWEPRTRIGDGLERVLSWVRENESVLFDRGAAPRAPHG